MVDSSFPLFLIYNITVCPYFKLASEAVETGTLQQKN